MSIRFSDTSGGVVGNIPGRKKLNIRDETHSIRDKHLRKYVSCWFFNLLQ